MGMCAYEEGLEGVSIFLHGVSEADVPEGDPDEGADEEKDAAQNKHDHSFLKQADSL